MSSFASAKGPSTTVRFVPVYLTRQPFELACRPEASSSTPACCSSSWYFAISPSIFSCGMTPASESLVALTMIMNRMVASPRSWVRSSTSTTNQRWRVRQAARAAPAPQPPAIAPMTRNGSTPAATASGSGAYGRKIAYDGCPAVPGVRREVHLPAGGAEVHAALVERVDGHRVAQHVDVAVALRQAFREPLPLVAAGAAAVHAQLPLGRIVL